MSATAHTTRALLTLGAAGVGAEVVDGTPEERAALELGTVWGRATAVRVLTSPSSALTFAWPADWKAAVDAYATGIYVAVYAPGDRPGR